LRIKMVKTTAWQSSNNSINLDRVTIERRDLRDDDIAVRINFCGVCHSDLHAIHGLMGKPTEGLVSGHEFTGVVTAIGSAVNNFSVGDSVAVGTIVDSCGECSMCNIGQENFCLKGAVSTYGGTDRLDGSITKGGYSRDYILRNKFAYHLAGKLDPAAAAPLMCAGITVWEPMKSVNIGPGSKVAIAGLGGLGHMGVKLATALGADVTVLSHTAGKVYDAKKLGAKATILTTDEEQMKQTAGQFDLILDTIAAPHDLSQFVKLLGFEGTLSVIGLPLPSEVKLMELAFGRKKITSSGTGGTKHTQELLDFCAEHGVTAEVEQLPSAQVDEALARLEKGDVRYRFVLDMSDLDT
jgi:uncharacterized zinc-type alcohol dehydrogenase-like protein